MKPLRLHSQTETPSSLSSASEMDDLVGGLDLADRVSCRNVCHSVKCINQLISRTYVKFF